MNSPYRSNPWLGRSLGDNQRYRLDNRIGAGGMGDVFLATDTRIGQQVALKLLKDTLVESPEMRKRFEHEIAICAALIDEHIVKIMDAGVTTEGYPFYVMEYLRGETLGELLRRERQLTVDRTIKIISQVCNGLLLAHQGVKLPSGEYIETVVHRDLKPDNIFLLPTDLGEFVKIVDFGIAKIRYKDYRPETLTHTFLGTLRYASPEQMMGDRDLDARADIYSLGVILYEMLSGADPFGFNIQSRQMSEASWVIAHTSGQPIPLRSQPGCEHLSPELEAIVLRCLAKTPELRFGSVADLKLALKAVFNSPTASPHRVAGETIVQPRPVVTPDGDDETIVKAILPTPIVEPEAPIAPVTSPETIVRPLAPSEPVKRPILEETKVQPLPSSGSGSAAANPAAKTNSPATPLRAETIAQPRPPALGNSQVEQGKTKAQPRSTGNTPPIEQPQVKSTDSKTPKLKLAVGLLLGLGSIGVIYLFTQNRAPEHIAQPPGETATDSTPPAIVASPSQPVTTPSPTISLAMSVKLIEENKLQAAIDSANKIPQSSPEYAQAQTLSTDATSLVTAQKLANRGELKAAIDLLEKISPTSPVYKKSQAYLKELRAV